MIDAADERELVRDLRNAWKNLADLQIGIVGADRLKWPADLARRVRLHVERVDLRRRAEIENEDARFVVPAFRDGARGLCGHQLRHRKPQRAECAHLLSLIHISEPTRLLSISYAVFCLK